MWRTIDMTDLCVHCDYVEQICRYAVDQSCGHLEDINIENFGTNDLLKYIADRASHLRRIRLSRSDISDKGLSKVAKRLPLLEELEISFSRLTENSLEAIGRCCPLLKVLKFSRNLYRHGRGDDDEAFAIAKNMPELCHLQLLGNRLTNDGLLAILDGCPRLESLDLRACSNVDLSGCLGKRCAEKIKDLRLPTDYLDDSFNDDSFYWDADFDTDYLDFLDMFDYDLSDD